MAVVAWRASFFPSPSRLRLPRYNSVSPDRGSGKPLSPGGEPAPCAGQLALPACTQEAKALLRPQRCQSCGAGSLQQEPWNTYFPSKRERRVPFPPPRHIVSYGAAPGFSERAWGGKCCFMGCLSTPAPCCWTFCLYSALSPLPEGRPALGIFHSETRAGCLLPVGVLAHTSCSPRASVTSPSCGPCGSSDGSAFG